MIHFCFLVVFFPPTHQISHSIVQFIKSCVSFERVESTALMEIHRLQFSQNAAFVAAPRVFVASTPESHKKRLL